MKKEPVHKLKGQVLDEFILCNAIVDTIYGHRQWRYVTCERCIKRGRPKKKEKLLG